MRGICGNMVLFLFLAAFFIAAADSKRTVRKELDISSCPMNFYGEESNKLYVTIHQNKVEVCLHRFCDQNGINKISISLAEVERTHLMFGYTLPSELYKKLEVNGLSKQPLHCSFALFLQRKNMGQIADLYYGNFGSHSFLFGTFSSGLAMLRVGFKYTGTWIMKTSKTFNKGEPQTFFLDLTACRKSGNFAEPGDPSAISQRCEVFRGCTSRGSLNFESTCEKNSQCDGHGRCVRKETLFSCSVLASAVFFNLGGVHFIEDRCSYNLISNDEFQLLGQFEYRRNTALPFLDSLHLTVASSMFYLPQGGRVYLNDSLLNLRRSLTLNNNVELSRDHNGVGLIVPYSKGNISISFDGNVALIEISGLGRVQGLCVGDSSVKTNRRMDFSDPGCRETFDNQPTENPSNLTAAIQLCNTMFTNDSFEVFTSTCNHLLSRYGDVDGLPCLIHSLYNRSTGQSMNNLRSCEATSACLRRHCAHHEFCVLTPEYRTKCLCRENIIYQYRASGKYGEKTDCGVDTASVELPLCVLENNGFDVTDLHLLDKACGGEVDQESHMVTFQFNHTQKCGAYISTNATHIMYKNSVVGKDPDHNVITRREEVYLNFSCSYMQPESTKTLRIEILDRSVIQEFEMGQFKYSVEWRVCHDVNCKRQLSRRDRMGLNEKLFVHLDAEVLDPDLVLLIDSCWGSVRTSNGELRHKLITNGCADPGDHTVRVMENGDGDHCLFSFRTFEFIKHPGRVQIHCKAGLCQKGGRGRANRCLPRCKGARGRRSLAEEGTAAFTFISWMDQVGATPEWEN